MVMTVLIAVGMLMAAVASGMLLNSFRAQENMRFLARQTEVSNSDTQFRRDLASAIFDEVVSSVMTGSTVVGPNGEKRYDYGGSIIDVANGVTALDERGNTIAGNSAIGSMNLGVVDWTPVNGGGYSLIDASSLVYRLTGSDVFVGKKFEIEAVRLVQNIDNFRKATRGGGARPATDRESMKIVVYEVPMQSLAAYGKDLIVPDNFNIAGSVLAARLRLATGASVASATVVDDLFWESGAIVNGIPLAGRKASDVAGAALAKSLEAGELSEGVPVGPESVSVIRSNEFAMMLELGDQGVDAEGVLNVLLPATTPTAWDAYVRPYYQCSVRIEAWMRASNDQCDIVVRQVPVGTLPQRLGAGVEVGRGVVQLNGPTFNGMQLLRNHANRVMLKIDPLSLAALVGWNNARAVYVDVRDSGANRSGNIGVMLSNLPDISNLQGFSLVTPNTLALQGNINTENVVPMSLFANNVLYGNSGAGTKVEFSGQVAKQNSGGVDVTEMRNDRGAVPVGGKTISLQNMVSAAQVPPVTQKIWLITAE